jgi:hypothetical protein
VKVSADKSVRAGPWAALAAGGKVELVKGLWNREFLDETAAFPTGAYDGQVDAVSGAHGLLIQHHVPEYEAWRHEARRTSRHPEDRRSGPIFRMRDLMNL